MKVNIYIQYHPGTTLKGEGIGRYTAKIFEGLLKSKIDTKFVAPFWIRQELNELLTDEAIAYDSGRLIFNKSGNPFFYLLHRALHRTPKKALDKFDTSKNKLTFQVTYLVDEFREFLLTSAASGIFAALLISMLVFPILLFFAPFYLLFKFSTLIAPVKSKAVTLIRVKLSSFSRKIYDFLYGYEVKNFNNFAKKQKCDVWYTPAAFWGLFNKLPQPRVVCVPDLSPIQFAYSYLQAGESLSDLQGVLNSVKETIENCDIILTYDKIAFSQSVSNNSNLLEKHVYEVNHAAMDLSSAIRVMDCPINSAEVRKFSEVLIRAEIERASVVEKYLKNYRLDGTNYIVFPSKIRPNKNVLMLVKAIEYLVRIRRISIKLVLTDDYNNDIGLSKYIEENRLKYEVLVFNRISQQSLAAVYHNAALAISPSKFEGGLPFTLSEALSVNTPVVLAKTKITEVRIPSEVGSLMCFDANDYRDIAAKIEWGLNNRDKLLEIQKSSLSSQLDRSWVDVADDYVEMFNSISSDINIDALKENDRIRKKDAAKLKAKKRRLLQR